MAILALTAALGFAPMAVARPEKVSKEALQTLEEAGRMIDAGTLKLRCLPYREFEGSDSCETLIGRFASLKKSEPTFAAIGPCTPAVCRTAAVGYRRDSASSILVLITLKPTDGDSAGAFRIAEIQISEGANTSD